MPRSEASGLAAWQIGCPIERREPTLLACVNNCDYTGDMILPSARQNLTNPMCSTGRNSVGFILNQNPLVADLHRD
jgi:hypothetical protein